MATRERPVRRTPLLSSRRDAWDFFDWLDFFEIATFVGESGVNALSIIFSVLA